MIGRFSLAGSDGLEVPAFFDTGDAAALARWKQEHPDWFEAGRWTPGRRGRGEGAEPPVPGGLAGWERAMARPLDPAGLSLADFRQVAAAARAGVAPGPEVMLAQHRGPARGRARFPGPPRTPAEEALELRFQKALENLRRLEPQNPQSTVLRDPTRAPGEAAVRALEREARAAALRNAARIPAGEGEADPATPLQRRTLRENMIRTRQMEKGSPDEAHHIVPGGGAMSGGRNPAAAQAIMRRFGIDLDSTLNGVGLSPAFHRRLHTRPYYDYVRDGLQSVQTREEAIAFLLRLSRRLKHEEVRYRMDKTVPDWSGVGE